MAKKGKRKKSSKKASAGVGETIRGTALEVVDEIEKAGGVVLGEIRSSFDFIGDKVTTAAKAAAGTTVAVKDRVTSQEVTDQLHELVQDVEDAGASLMHAITGQFESLRKSIAKAPKATRPRKTKKKAVKKKAKKKAVRKKAAKKTVKKKATRKKAVKKKATRKKAARKKTTRKKATRKKATRKKATRKTAAKKKATRKTATRKKARKR